MVNHIAIKKAIRNGLKSKSILTEDDAREIAKQYITEEEEDFEITLAISSLLPRKINRIVFCSKVTHSWFADDVVHIVYVDDFGRMWSKSTGNIKGDIPIREVNGQFIVDKLGGMVWNSDDGVKFVCEYRTNIDELSLAINPQTFIG